jgi:hypothetical protein
LQKPKPKNEFRCGVRETEKTSIARILKAIRKQRVQQHHDNDHWNSIHNTRNAQRRFAKTRAGAETLHANVLDGALGANQHRRGAAEHEIGDRRWVAGGAHQAPVRERLKASMGKRKPTIKR